MDGVYDSDPAKNPDAKRLEKARLHEAVTNPEIKVMDKAAIGLASEHDRTIIVFDIMKPDNLKKLIEGEPVGSKIH